MSICSRCLERLCRAHPLQDHGARAKQLKAQVKDKKGVLSNLYDDLITRELQRRMRESEGTSSKEVERYRSEMEEEREKAGRKSKKISREHEMLAQNSDLHGSIVHLMAQHDSDEDHDEEEKSSERKRSKKRSKKEKKNKKEKKSKKEKKHKKAKQRSRSMSSHSSASEDSDAESASRKRQRRREGEEASSDTEP